MIDNIKIAVTYHKDYPIHSSFKDNNIFALVACGNYQNANMLKDDSKYSHLNKYINEATVLYWLYLNWHILGNPEFLGLFHYRRKLNIDYSYNIGINDIITSEIHLWNIVKKDFLQLLGNDGINFLTSMIKHIFSDNHNLIITEWMNLSILYQKNMFVMHKSIFNEYINALTRIIEDIVIPNLGIDAVKKQPRFFGFCIEWFTGFFIYDLEHYYNANIIRVPLSNI